MKFHRLYNVLGPTKSINALIILNGPSLDPKLLDLVWPLNQTIDYPVVCADGGANLLYDQRKPGFQPTTNPPRKERAPTHIVGDLDSVRKTVLNHYNTLGTRVIKDPDQNANDFQKALAISNSVRNDPILPTVVIGGYGGRMDQTLGNLNTLYSAAQQHQDILWLEPSNLVLALSPGRHHISIDPSREGPTCGLIPIGHPVQTVSTEGLRWNLDEQSLSYGNGGLVSSSNEVLEQTFVVETSHPLIWTLELHLDK